MVDDVVSKSFDCATAAAYVDKVRREDEGRIGPTRREGANTGKTANHKLTPVKWSLAVEETHPLRNFTYMFFHVVLL